jgi:pyridoxine 4-dehydrogenase
MSDFAHLPSTIGFGDHEVYRLGFGAMQIPGPMVWGEPRDPERARATLKRVVSLGIQVIDTSWYYGPFVSNRFIAETLYPYPNDLVIVTKLGGKRTPDKGWAPALRPEELRQGCEEDLKGLKKERIDVVNLRWIGHSEVPFREALDAMIALKKEGKVGHIALSNVTLAQLHEGLERTPIVGVENLYNVAAGEKRLGNLPLASVADQEQIVDLCAARGMAFLPFFSLAIPGASHESPAVARAAKRHGVTVAQVATAWLLARSPAMLPIPGTSSPEHLEQNWAARKIKLSPEEVAEITAARDA